MFIFRPNHQMILLFLSPDFHSYIQTLKNLGKENKKLYDRYITCLYFGGINNPLN